MEKIKLKLYNNFKDPIDVYSAITPLFNVCSFFGLAPYSLIRLENGRKEFKFAWYPLIRNALLVICLVASVTYNAFSQTVSFGDSNIQQKLRYCQEIFSSLLSCCSVIFGCIFAVKICQVFQNIDEVDGAFRALAVWVPYKNLYISIILHLLGITLLTTLLIVQFASVSPSPSFGIISVDLNELYWIYMEFMTIFLPYFINLLMELQYCHYLNILRIRYRLLNEYLEALVHESSSHNEGWTDIGLAEPLSVMSYPEKKKRPISTPKIPKSMMAISDPVYIVDQVAALHIKLTDTAHMINYAFCVQQLLRITVAFISIVVALFLVAINFSKSSTDKSNSSAGADESAELDYFFTAWAFSNACEVMAIVWITSETCEEANTCPRILHKIRNNTNNTNLQDTIEIYSLQMYHNRLYFTVCGLFPLDYTLLYTIVAGVTTYLVILIQFNNADFVKNTANATNISNGSISLVKS